MADHDNGYKLLFSHARMVANLVRGFVDEDWGADLDFSSLRYIDENYFSRAMYLFLDAGTAEGEQKALQDVIAALLQLDKIRRVEEVDRFLQVLVVWLGRPGSRELKQAFSRWLLGALGVPGMEPPKPLELVEVRSMLAERVVEWTQEWKREGFEEGRREGLQEARQEALRQAREILLQQIEERFGPLTGSIRSRLEVVDSIRTLSELIGRVSRAGSLAELGLG